MRLVSLDRVIHRAGGVTRGVSETTESRTSDFPLLGSEFAPIPAEAD